jgi:hypothetical protein
MKGDRHRWDVLKCSIFDTVSSEKTFEEISKTFHAPTTTLSWFSTDSSCGVNFIDLFINHHSLLLLTFNTPTASHLKYMLIRYSQKTK